MQSIDVLSVEARSCCLPHQQLSCDEFESHIAELAAHIHAATYRLLVLIARHGTAWHVEQLVRQYHRVKRLEESAEAERVHDERYLQFSMMRMAPWSLKPVCRPTVGRCC